MPSTTRRNARPSSPSRAGGPGAMGCGIDIVELPRFGQAVRRGGAAFLNRIFTSAEQRYARRHRDPLPHLAVRFAAKEAVIKALSQLLPAATVSFSAIEIRNAANGRPRVALHAPAIRPVDVQISLSHSEGIAVACAIATLAA